MKKSGFLYNADVPSLARELMDGTISAEGMQALAQSAKTAVLPGHEIGDLSLFAYDYINALSDSYNYGFGVACISLVVSMIIYISSKKLYKQADVNTKQAKNMKETSVNVEELTPAQTRTRMTALFLVFAVVIVFWMSFQQSGLGLTLFAKEYTQGVASGLTRLGFDIVALVLIAVGVYAAFSTFQSDKKKARIISAIVWVLTFAGAAVKYFTLPQVLTIRPEDFQQFNPFFIVIFTPFVMLLSTASARKGKEISAPRKIGIGMIMAAAAYLIMALVSVNIISRVSPNWLISTYFALTLAELMLSPIGISFVTKVAPPKYKGMMMGCWFGVSAIGNYLTKVITKFWDVLPLWQVWSILIVLCCVSAIFMFSIMKRLEKATADC
jgi:Dipeptide/tripeptide permease